MPAAGINWETNPAVASAEWNNSGTFDVKAFPAATNKALRGARVPGRDSA
jgi:hypothetical protein